MPSLTHGLDAAHFAALAGGYGDAACVAALRAGQSSRRRLLLRAVAEAAPAARAALNLLSEVAGAAPEIAEAALNHPMLGVWASTWLRQQSGQNSGQVPSHTGYLTGLAAAAAARAQVPFHLTAPIVGGSVPLPGLGTAHGQDWEDALATISATAGTLVVTGPGATVEVAYPYTADGPGWFALRGLSTVDTPFAVDDLDPYRDCFGWPAASRLGGQEMSSFQNVINLAWQQIQAKYPRHAEAMRGSLTTLVPLSGADLSAASRLAFGAIGVCVTDEPDDLALLLIHEFQHMKLGALLDMVKLHPDTGPAIHWAPWRADPRPVPALLQGTYAHLGVCDYWRTRQRHGAQSRPAQVEFAYWHAQTSRAAAALTDSGELTDAGQRFVGYIRQSLAAWEPELGPADIRAAAEDLADSAAVTWQLTNRPTDPDIIRQLSAAYLQGAPCPDLSPATVQSGTTAGAAKPSPLAILLRQALTGPNREAPASRAGPASTGIAAFSASPATAHDNAPLAAGGPTALDSGPDADIAYVRRDYRIAVTAYLARITRGLSQGAAPDSPGSAHVAAPDRANRVNGATPQQTDDDTAAWAGLALSLRRLSRRPLSRGTMSAATAAAALLARPELVRAVVRDIGADPLALALWLGKSLLAAPGQSIGRRTALLPAQHVPPQPPATLSSARLTSDV